MQTNGNRTLLDILRVTVSNVLKVISGILVGFLLPKLLGVQEFGFYKTCTLYATYIGLCSIGLVDAVVWRFSSCEDLARIEQKPLRSVTRCFLLIQLIFAAVGIGSSFIMTDRTVRAVLLYSSSFLIGSNSFAFFQNVLVAGKCFSAYSRLTVLQAALNAIVVALLLLLEKSGFVVDAVVCMTWFVILQLGLSFSCMLRLRHMVFGEGISRKNVAKELRGMISYGFPLMVANLCTLLILSVDRQFVNILFDGRTYALYAFAYNVITMALTVLSAISTVLFPVLLRMEKKDMIERSPAMLAAVVAIASIAVCTWFPLAAFIRWFLPDYEGALPVLRIILAGLLISTPVTIVVHNIYKAMNHNLRFCLQAVGILALSALLDWAAYCLWGSVEAISAVSVLALFVWAAVSMGWLMLRYHVRLWRSLICIVLQAAAFYGITMLEFTAMPGLLLQLCAAVFIMILCTGKDLRSALSFLRGS